MNRQRRIAGCSISIFALISGILAGACSSGSSGPNAQGADAGAPATPAGGDEGKDPAVDGGPPRGDGSVAPNPGSHPNCEAYLACIAAAKPKEVGDATGVYGPSGTCWRAQDEPTCETRCGTLMASVHTEQPSVAACGKATVKECLQCVTDSFLYRNCGTPGCQAVQACVEACNTTACVAGCVNNAPPADGKAFVDQFGYPRLDVVCNGPSGKCYEHCAGIASFFCPAFGVTPAAP